MLNASLILLNILLYTMQTLFFKMYADRYPGKARHASYVYLSVGGIFAAFVSYAVNGFNFEFNTLTFIFGVIEAAVFFLYYYSFNLASGSGPYSIVMLFSVVGGMCIPILTSFIAFGEAPSVWQILCYLVVFCASWFVVKKPEENENKVKTKKGFFIAVSVVGFVNGLFGGIINLQHAYTGASQKDEMLIYTYLLTALFSLFFLVFQNKKEIGPVFKQTRGSFLFMVLAAVVAASAVNMLVFIAEFINVNLLWTFNSSGVLVFSVIASAIIFKEKMSRQNIIACAVIAVMLVVISVV